MENNFEQRLDEIIYRTAVIKVQTQSLLKDLLSKLDEDALNGYVVDEYDHIFSIKPGTLLCEVADQYDENFWDGTFEDMSHEDQLDLIKHIMENKLHENICTGKSNA